MILVTFLFEGLDAYKKLREWTEDYLNQAYTIVFETSIPKGEISGERILNLAKAIFPQLRDDYRDLLSGYLTHLNTYIKKKIIGPKKQQKNLEL